WIAKTPKRINTTMIRKTSRASRRLSVQMPWRASCLSLTTSISRSSSGEICPNSNWFFFHDWNIIVLLIRCRTVRRRFAHLDEHYDARAALGQNNILAYERNYQIAFPRSRKICLPEQCRRRPAAETGDRRRSFAAERRIREWIDAFFELDRDKATCSRTRRGNARRP